MLNMLAENAPLLLDLFAPDVQNKVMKRRMESAIKAVEGIKSQLLEYGLKVDYEKYFEEKLQIPLTAVRTLSELETDSQRELLQNLFARHISGQYDNDGDYVSFIHIIQELNGEDIDFLMRLKSSEEEGEELKPEGSKSEVAIIRKLFKNGLIDIYHEVEVLKAEGEVPSELEIDGSETGREDRTWGAVLGKQKAVQAGSPYLTEYGREFLYACTASLSEKESS